MNSDREFMTKKRIKKQISKQLVFVHRCLSLSTMSKGLDIFLKFINRNFSQVQFSVESGLKETLRHEEHGEGGTFKMRANLQAMAHILLVNTEL